MENPSPHRIPCIVILTLLLFFTACSGDVMLHQYKPVDVGGWGLKDTVRFDIPATDASGDYDLHVGLRFKHDYDYSNVWLVVEQLYEQPFYNVRDTIELSLTDDDNQLQGGGTSLLQTEHPVTTTHLHQGQSGQIKVYHITMPPASLPGISDVGIKIK